jgi:hypothetical protein
LGGIESHSDERSASDRDRLRWRAAVGERWCEAIDFGAGRRGEEVPEGRKAIWPLLEAPPFENVAAGTLAPLSGGLKYLRVPPSSPTAMPPAALMAMDRTLFAGTVKFGVELLLTGIVYCCTPPATLSLPT